MNRLRTSLTVLSVLLVGGLVAACQHDVESSYAAGLSAIDPDGGPFLGDDAAAYPETLSLQQGSDDVSDYSRATGYVQASILDTWAAFKNPDVVADRHGISSYTSTENVEPTYPVSFAINCTVNQIVTVNFTLTWREGPVAGTLDAPQAISVDYQKTDGSSFISLMTGTIGLVAVTPGVTKLEFNQRMNADDSSSSNIASWTTEMYNSVVATVHGKPLP